MRNLLKFAPAGSQALMRFLIATSLGAFMSACTTQHAIVTGSLNYNNALADSQNKLILLNAVRAAHRYPMYFSGIGSVTNQNEKSFELGADHKFGTGMAEGVTISPSMTLNGGSSSIDYSNLNSEGFARKAFFEEIPLDTVQFYINNGWNTALVFNLLINQFSINKPYLKKLMTVAQKICNRAPDENSKRAKNRQVARLLANCNLLRSGTDDDAFSEYGNMVVVRHTNGFRPYVALYEILGARVSTTTPKGTKIENRKLDRGKLSYEIKSKKPVRILTFANPIAEQELKKFKNKIFVVEYRSTQSVLYHLGELIRNQLSGSVEIKQIPTLIESPDTKYGYAFQMVDLFKVLRGKGPRNAVNVTFRGQHFHIPENRIGDDRGHRSHQVLALINQLLALQTSETAVTKPSTVVIR